MEPNLISYCATQAKVKLPQAKAALVLLLEEDCTVPFISRYRKEVTGNLNEIQIRDLEKYSGEFLEREKRREFILVNLEKMEVLDAALRQAVAECESLRQLEELYAPYKSKRKTKAMVARENGLDKLAETLFTTKCTVEALKAAFVPTEKVKSFDDALEGAKHILIEKIAQNPSVRSSLRQLYKKSGRMVSKKKKDIDKIKDAPKYRDYFDFAAPVSSLLVPKVSHRFHAMSRGKAQNVLRLGIEVEEVQALQIVQRQAIPKLSELGCIEVLKECIGLSFKKSLHPSMEGEWFSELKTVAENTATTVFCVNLRNLLLAPYLGSKTVMGIDPGVRTGCKVVVVDATGKFLCDFKVFLHQKGVKLDEAQQAIEKFIEALHVEYIAIGSGTYGRETLAFLEEKIPQIKSGTVKATLISESGASVYSASEAAIEEFPDKDVTVRGAISIARRFQDPLSELVKIDPKSIGVGQYQHDINQSKLQKSLKSVVEDCVNFVGVDLNTASYHILSHISGMGPALSKNVVEFRGKNGPFKSRGELLKVGRFSDKVFQQAAGFLRIYNGENPFDGTFVHPERVSEIENWCQQRSIEVGSLLTLPEVQKTFSEDRELENKIGKHTFQDILQSLKAPSQDPRTHFKSTEYDKSLKSLEDVKLGGWYTGVINNITHFGAFVDIGIKESGLVHVSQLSERFVEDPLKVVKVGEEIKVRVLELDLERKRLALSCRSEDAPRPRPKKNPNARKMPKKRKEKPINPHSPFAVLQTLKTKR